MACKNSNFLTALNWNTVKKNIKNAQLYSIDEKKTHAQVDTNLDLRIFNCVFYIFQMFLDGLFKNRV